MKCIKLLTTVIALLIMSTTFAQKFSLDFKNSKKAIELVKNYTSALQQGDIAKMTAQLAEGAMIIGLGGTDSLTVKQHADYFKNSTDQFKHTLQNDMYMPVKVENDDFYQGEWVLSWGVNILTNKKSNASFDIPYHVVSLVANGKIQRIFYFYDMLPVLQAQGYTITPPKDAEAIGRALHDSYSKALANDDFEAISKMYTQDATIMNVDGKVYRGNKDIKEVYKAFISQTPLTIELKNQSSEFLSDDMISSTDTFILKFKDKNIDDVEGAVFNLYKNDNGTWKIYKSYRWERPISE